MTSPDGPARIPPGLRACPLGTMMDLRGVSTTSEGPAGRSACDISTGAQILVDLGLSTIRQLTNNPKKIVGLEGYGLKVVERVPIEVEPGDHNARYLQTKRDKMGHMLHHNGLDLSDGAPAGES